MRKILLFSFMLTMFFSLHAALPVTTSFDESVRTVQIHPVDMPLAPPVTVLGQPDILVASFDGLSDDREFFRWRLVHCNADWTPSVLVDSEFVDGFNEQQIEDYSFSSATTVPYVHYTFTIPGENMRPLVSGNYVAEVYREDDPDTVVAQFAFMVTEQTVPVSVSVSPVTDIDYRAQHQQLEVGINVEDAGIEDVFNDLQVHLFQNNRPDTEQILRRPLTVSGSNLTFAHNPALIFPAGNEYRRFETVTENYPGMGVEKVEYVHPYWHYALNIDSPRAGERYQYDSTQKGAYLIRRSGASDSDVEADYGVVHFYLEDENPDRQIFIEGDITDRLFNSNSRMVYNPSFGRYERALLLKQGSYNYQYVERTPAGKFSTADIEGNNFETQNTYQVRVYHRRRGERYDRLIGVGFSD